MLLLDGEEMPRIGIGTWPIENSAVEALIPQAVQVGYRMFDTADGYGNHQGVGRGIARCGASREDVFLITKLRGRDQGTGRARKAVERFLQELDVDYLDLCLVHWPNPNDGLLVPTWEALLAAKDDGLVRSVGVSNFTPAHIQLLVDQCGVTPSVNQIQLFPSAPREGERTFHSGLGIVTQAWSPLGLGVTARHFRNTNLVEEPPTCLTEIAAKHGVTVVQVILRWHLELGVIPIPKSANLRRLTENFDIFRFSLDEEDLLAINGLARADEPIVDADLHHEY